MPALPDDPTWRIGPLMDALCALEATVNENLPAGLEPLNLSRWRPRNEPELPGLWNWLGPAPQTALDTAANEEVFQISAYVAVEHSDADEQMLTLEGYADAFRYTIDTALYRSWGTEPPLENTATRAIRTGMRPTTDEFARGEGRITTAVLAIEFPLSLWVNRIIAP